MNESCDHHLETLSDCLDEKRVLPQATLDHLSQCDECRAFHDMWMEDSGPLATLAGTRDLPDVPPSLAQDLAVARKTVAGPWKPKLRPWWPAIAAALVVAAGLAWWNSGSEPASNSSVAENAPDIRPDANDKVKLPLKISEIDTGRLERGLAIYSRARARSLDRSGHRLARLTVNIRDVATNSPHSFPPWTEHRTANLPGESTRPCGTRPCGPGVRELFRRASPFAWRWPGSGER